jgi:hypothetical protein
VTGPVPQRRVAVVAVIAAALAAMTLAGCGIGVNGNRTSKRVSVRVTTAFGSHTVGTGSLASFPSADTVMNFTKHFFPVTTSDGGGFVDSIKGQADDESKKLDWFYYVNGIEAPLGAAATSLHSGDHVWWDLHDWHAAQDVPAVVGSYPEPFLSGSGGQSYPTVVTCGPGFTKACQTVTKSLGGSGVKVSFQGLGTGSGSDSLALLVGTFNQLQGVIASELLKAGPGDSGVYAQFVGPHGQVLEVDNPAGDVVGTYHGSVGLIAAIEQEGLNEPVWLVTGTDQAGVNAAAAALTPAKLADHFAVAVLPSGKILPLPLAPGS